MIKDLATAAFIALMIGFGWACAYSFTDIWG